MVNLHLKFKKDLDKDLIEKICNSIHEALKGNKGYVENDIVFNIDDAKNDKIKAFLISLGDDADQNPKTIDIYANIKEVESDKSSLFEKKDKEKKPPKKDKKKDNTKKKEKKDK